MKYAMEPVSENSVNVGYLTEEDGIIHIAGFNGLRGLNTHIAVSNKTVRFYADLDHLFADSFPFTPEGLSDEKVRKRLTELNCIGHLFVRFIALWTCSPVEVIES